MNMKHLLLSLSLISVFALNAQQNYCGTDENARKLREQFPQILDSEQKMKEFTEWFKANKNNFSRDEDKHYIIPVVFHILHDGGVENIPDSKLAGQEMTNINEYFSATNPELGGSTYPSVHASFREIVADMNIEFRLARKDPQGNCTNGIDRIYTNATRVGNNDTKINPWPRDKYLNIWVAKAVEMDTFSSGTIAYSMYPSGVDNQVNNNVIDGVQSKHVGVGASAGFMRHVIAHEIGHWLNLQHVWGGTNSPGVACGDDEVEDTPVTMGQSGGCNQNEMTCGHLTNVQNIMNYADCGIMFTEGQRERARAAVESDIAQRSNLWSVENLATTGVEPLYECLPIPKAEFGLNARYLCIGQNVRLTDFSFNSSEWEREWTFPEDVVNASGNDSIQNISFSTPGWKTITLKVSNASGTSSITKTAIYVRDATANPIPYPFYETFDDVSAAEAWVPINYDNNATTFAHSTSVGHYSNGAFALNDYDATFRGDRDELISPAFDLTGISETDFRFSFEYSFACRFDHEMTNAYYDSIASLEVHILKDCGASSKRVARIIGNRQLMNGGFINASYVPGQSDQYWKKVVVNLAGNTPYKAEGVQIRFVVIGAKNGNNFYLDNFNIGNAPTGINDEDATIAELQLFPNPTANNTTLIINPAKEGTYKVEVLDLVGKTIATAFDGRIAGETEVNINTSSLSQGVYLVQVSSNGKTQLQKLVKM